MPVRVWVGIDARQNKIPGWLLKGFQKTEFIAEIDEGANPFGREAMKQGARSTVTVAKGETFRIAFGALGHQHETIDLADDYTAFEKLSVADEANNNNR